MTIEQPRLLFIDSYDSFTFNLASLCRRAVPNCIIYIIKNDDFTIEELQPFLGYFAAIVVGPGPGSPDKAQDIGIVKDIWKIKDEYILPVFGVCLGLQSLGVEFGARLQRLRVVKHGQVSTVHHHGVDLFDGIGRFGAVRYHSLHVALPEDGELEELAWTNDGEANGHVVMALRHKIRPFWAVQYHPESICTERGGADIIGNFWQLAREWARDKGRIIRPWDASAKRTLGNPWPFIEPHSPPPTPSLRRPVITTKVLDLPGLSVIAVAELFGALDDSSPFALLDSAAKPGRFSIVASLLPTSLQITHFVQDTFVTLTRGESVVREELGSCDVWSWLAAFMRGHKATGCPEIPFWGGLIGQLSYELGVHSLCVPLKADREHSNMHPDVNLIFVERSVVLDTTTNRAYVQSLIPGDDQWIEDTSVQLLAASSQTPSSTTFRTTPSPIITLPDRTRYISRINEAKDKLFAGDSYELCLTAPTRISIPNCSPTTPTSWDRYKLLRQKNPAPHSAFLRLHPSTLLSSSPERFLSFSRPPHSTCQLRPIKGTVRKAPGITRAVAEQMLGGSTKEVAENLMIVDLIRHDLHGVVGEDVQVQQFCAVEEYETVWQLVSVIEGRLAENSDAALDPDSEVGWEVLKRSLPPGSMTGAPKKRSVEILTTLEDDERSLYSGVFGYWCVGGGGDWSVTIRSCFKYQQPGGRGNHVGPAQWTEEWTIGAGGAITALSDAEAEWDEMVIKLQSVLSTFGASPAP
ncbi:putative anthranilate synthase component I, N terminal region [Lyophyllum shimeji]|uniref:aminodeoxychorismate synthase n=1 Tax=Lyophyllum shimeji TaxID=47721 RepID=A0A9P3ULQ3_LYOSH|nr:putative anthranilate synthase component I, N terminal region [Lyophyllum shimeji]